MPLTITRTGFSPSGGQRPIRSGTASDLTMVMGQFTFTGTYVSGGETLAPSAIGLKEILFMTFDGGMTGVSGIRCNYDYATRTVKAYGGSGVTAAFDREVPHGTSLTWATVRFIAFGRAAS